MPCMLSRCPSSTSLISAIGVITCFALANEANEFGFEEVDFEKLDYVKVLSGRCTEMVGVLPVGGPGENWTSDLDLNARVWCHGNPECQGFMRYVGKNAEHCAAWCGRPQFCGHGGLLANDDWASYLHARALGTAFQNDHEVDVPSQRVDIQCPWPYQYVGSVVLTSGSQDVAAADDDNECRILHHRPGDKVAFDSFDGVLSEDQGVVPFFSAITAGPDEQGPSVYSIDRNEYLERTPAGLATPKRHMISFFFLSSDSLCANEPMELDVAMAQEAFPDHVYVEDGTEKTRKKAFGPYHFTALCGGTDDNAAFPPQAMVDALSMSTHPLVPRKLHRKLARIFFHLPDAVQAFGRIHPAALLDYVEDMYYNPDKNDAMYFKQSFMFLMQDLLWYRYRQPFQMRLTTAACALCRERKRISSISKAAEMNLTDFGVYVSIAFCIMSRRQALNLRKAVRESWGTLVDTHGHALRFFVGKAAEDAKDISLEPDVVELLNVPEAYNAVTLKAFSMLEWAHDAFPNLQFLIRVDDDVYLRPQPLLAQLASRPPVMYLWGNFDHGSNPVRDPSHPHYNSYQQFPERIHPLFGDVFPPYARGHLWAMSSDLLAAVVDAWRNEKLRHSPDAAITDRLPHPDDPALGTALNNLVEGETLSLNLDDRDLNAFALNPSCNSTFLNIHSRTWVVHHVDAETIYCMWTIDSAAMTDESRESSKEFPDLCSCSMNVVEEVDPRWDEDEPFDYPRDRFNEDWISPR